MVHAGLVRGPSICAHDRFAAAAEQFERDVPGARLLASNREVVEQSDILVLAVKPQNLQDASIEAGSLGDSGQALDLAAGRCTDQCLERRL